MLKKLNKSNQGFTIIEVLIVLAIAALILLIVFLAVPALQRNTRNTTRKQDAGRIASAVNNWVSNHNGSAPTPADTAVAQSIVDDAGNLGQYPNFTGSAAIATNALAVTQGIAGTTGNTTLVGTNHDRDGMLVVQYSAGNGAKCNSSNDATVAGTSARSIALLYTSENGDGKFSQHCQDI